MMTQQQILREIMSLPRSERKELVDRINKNLSNEEPEETLSREEIIARRKEAIDFLRGIAAVPGKRPPTDEEWREERTKYLLEKHK